jgi:hypothetical protein
MRTHRSARLPSAMSGGLVVVMLAAVLAGCGHGQSGLGRLTIDGQAQLTPAAGKAKPASTGQVVKAGDQLEVTSGTAIVRLNPNGTLELRAGTHLTMDKVPRVTDGDVLIEPEGRALSVSAGTSTLAVPTGAAQISRVSGDLTAKVYKATSTLEIPGNPPLVVTAPREAVLTISSLLPISATPLTYAEGDSWDRRYLATVESFARQLSAAATGFDAQLAPGQGHDPAFFQQLVPALAQRADFVPAFQVIQALQPSGASAPSTPGDYLIATVIALHGTRGTLSDRMRDELVFKAQNADWGLVAYDQGVSDLLGVLNDVLAAIGRAKLPFAGGSAQVAITPTTAITPLPAGRAQLPIPTTAAPTTTTQARGSAFPHQLPTTTTSPPLLQLPRLPAKGDPLGPILNPLLNPLIDALNALLAGHH